jgi:hypothetical protein
MGDRVEVFGGAVSALPQIPGRVTGPSRRKGWEAGPPLGSPPAAITGLPVNSLRPSYEPGQYLAFLGRLSPDKGPEAAIRIAGAAGTPVAHCRKAAGHRTTLLQTNAGNVDDAIENGVGIGGIADEVMPFVHGDLAGDEVDRRP